MDTKKPKVSIITVTYNCKDTVEKTICNVLKQTYPNVEYIVIDGNSTDGTKEIIEKYSDRLAYWVSEPDKGIYDAMNKGIKVATGEWILFRNSGDYFFSPTTIEDVFAEYEDEGEFCIAGRTRFFENDGYYDSVQLGQICDIWARPYFSHPSTFIRTELQKANPYPADLRISGDYFFFQKMLTEGKVYTTTPVIVSLFDNETGVSSRNRVLSAREKVIVAKRLNAPAESVRSLKRESTYKWCVSILSSIPLCNRMLTRLRKKKRAGWNFQPQNETLASI